MICLLGILLTGPWIVSNYLLLTMEIAGILGGAWAILVMKIYKFNIIPDVKQDAELVIKGPYKYIRHPMYSFLLLLTLSLVVDTFSLWRFTIWLILFIDLLLKLHFEEKLLTEHFPDYSSYRKTTKRIIPFVY